MPGPSDKTSRFGRRSGLLIRWSAPVRITQQLPTVIFDEPKLLSRVVSSDSSHLRNCGVMRPAESAAGQRGKILARRARTLCRINHYKSFNYIQLPAIHFVASGFRVVLMTERVAETNSTVSARTRRKKRVPIASAR